MPSGGERDGGPRAPGADTKSRYTAAELGRLVGVSAATVRGWAAHGLLPQVPVQARPAFGFRHLARARVLARFHRHGWSAPRIARALAAARAVVDDVDEALAGIELDGPRRPVTLRLADGRLCTADGQGLLDFGAGRKGAGGVLGLRSPQDWFQLGVEAESAGRLAEAVAAYERALPGAGAEAWFNLGNCRYQLGESKGAEAAFAAAVAAAPEYPEAWNNLGIARGARGRTDGAIEAFRRALDLRPHYADAHYNLADALAGRGDLAAARAHWRAYLVYDPFSPWADQVRRRLRAGDGDAG